MTDHAAAATFVARWSVATLNERATAQPHFVDLCHLLGVPTPEVGGPNSEFYRFEKPLTKSGGGAGFADVWHRGRFAWEYKSVGKYPTLDAAYQQLLLYKGDLENPPVLVACDIATYRVSVEFTGYPTRSYSFTNADLANADTRRVLRLVLTNPEELRPVERAETVTTVAASRLGQVAQLVERRGFTPAQHAPFFMRVLFALFAEDIQLLPAELMSQSVRQAIMQPAEFVPRVQALFTAMRDGGYFGIDRVPRFNGGLFDDTSALALNADELQLLAEACKLDWSQVEPAIFGTLFERSLDPAKRAQLGAHYTSRADILLIVEPVIMTPLRRTWASVRAAVDATMTQAAQSTSNAARSLRSVAQQAIFDFMDELARVQILDPACGSGNFLYVALGALKDLEKEVWTFAGGYGLEQPDLAVSPLQLHGIEKNAFAAELAQVVIWIGVLQWQRANGFWNVQEPILQYVQSIECRDAILASDKNGQPIEPAWPTVDYIVGNPPFIGSKKQRSELGDQYIESLFRLYNGRMPREADLVAYWFEKARAHIGEDKVKRAGLIATNSIRGGANRKVLERIKASGNIFLAWSDREWVLDGAAVRVSMVGFDANAEQLRMLNGVVVADINPDLTAESNLTSARRLPENRALAFMGTIKNGAFDISATVAQQMRDAPNTAGVANNDVIFPWRNGLDITRTPRNMWVIDFGAERSRQDAMQYELPFKHVETYVQPERAGNRNPRVRDNWWLHEATRPEMRKALVGKARYISTPRVAKYRLFVFLDASVNPDCQIIVVARDDDYFFGMLHSRFHEMWSLRMGTFLGVGNDPRYTPTTTFETYPFPWPPGREDQSNPQVATVADAARALVAARDAWLATGQGPAGVLGTAPEKERTLTGLYNRRPDWLAALHQTLDAAVAACYSWPADLSDDEILARLLALNGERAAQK